VCLPNTRVDRYHYKGLLADMGVKLGVDTVAVGKLTCQEFCSCANSGEMQLNKLILMLERMWKETAL
jgi:hypothetical protein